MKCNEIRELLPDLAAGLIVAEPEVNNHLRSCSDCAGKLAEFQKTMALLDEWVAPEPSQYFDTRLHARLREEAAKQPSRWLSWMNLRRPVLAASLVAVVAIGASVFRLEEKKLHHPTPTVASVAEPGTAVGDLQALDQNHDVYADSDLMDDLQVQEDVHANP
ncbi:MAG: anti-sigma factor family protein [Terriglobales bacterium]